MTNRALLENRAEQFYCKGTVRHETYVEFSVTSPDFDAIQIKRPGYM